MEPIIQERKLCKLDVWSPEWIHEDPGYNKITTVQKQNAIQQYHKFGFFISWF